MRCLRGRRGKVRSLYLERGICIQADLSHRAKHRPVSLQHPNPPLQHLIPAKFSRRTRCHSSKLTSQCRRSLIPFAQGLLRLTPISTDRLPIVRPQPGQKTPPIKTQARGATILPNFVGLVFQVHNGKIYHDVTITEAMVGHKLGEFSP